MTASNAASHATRFRRGIAERSLLRAWRLPTRTGGQAGRSGAYLTGWIRLDPLRVRELLPQLDVRGTASIHRIGPEAAISQIRSQADAH